AVTAYAASYLVPVKYESKAVMLIHPQESPIEFVHNNSEEQVEDQVEILTRMVLTRDNLVRLLRSLEIEKKEKTLDQQVKALNEAISTHFSPMTKNPKMGGSFELRYIGSNPVTVRKVTSALVDLMLSRSRKYREERLMGSSEFLSTQLRELREQLIETDKKRNRQEISRSASE